MLTPNKIVEAVRQEMANQHINQMDLANRLKVHFATVNGIFLRKSISLSKLIAVSQCLNFNFFRLIADELDLKLERKEEGVDKMTDGKASIQKDKVRDEELKELRLRNQFLEEMNAKLLKAIAAK